MSICTFCLNDARHLKHSGLNRREVLGAIIAGSVALWALPALGSQPAESSASSGINIHAPLAISLDHWPDAAIFVRTAAPNINQVQIRFNHGPWTDMQRADNSALWRTDLPYSLGVGHHFYDIRITSAHNQSRQIHKRLAITPPACK